MKLTIARSELLETLSITGRGVSSRSTLPILSGILFAASADGMVRTHSTDLEVSVKHTTTALVEQEGMCVVPSKLLTDIIRSLPEAAVTLSVENQTASITCGQASFTVKTLPPNDFPRFPEVEVDKKVRVPSVVLSQMVAHVSKAVSRDETRPILTGILLVVDGPTIKMVATDSYRLAVKETILKREDGEDIEVVVPGRTIDEVVKLTGSAPEVVLGVSENQIVFEIGETVFVTRRIEGAFPNYKQLIPKDHETEVVVSREEFAQAVKRVSLLAQHNTPLKVAVNEEDKTLSLSATTQDIGDASEDLMAEVKGPNVEIAFNHAFLSDGISAASGDTITLEIVSALKPGVIRAAGDEGFLYLLMPVRLG